MAAKKKTRPKVPDLHEMVALHVRGTRRVQELVAEAERLRGAGKKAAARTALAKAEKIEAILRALEAEVRSGTLRREK